MCIWLPLLPTESAVRRHVEMQGKPFVLSAPQHGRMTITAANRLALNEGIRPGQVLADARALLPGLLTLPHNPDELAVLLEALADWCLRFSPVVAVAPPDALLLDITGCAHLWGGERAYLNHIVSRFARSGYEARAAIADTIGLAWAQAHFGPQGAIVPSGQEMSALKVLPPAALRLETDILTRLEKLGFEQIGQFAEMPGSVLRRRFGDSLQLRLKQALGREAESLNPVIPKLPYEVHLPCLEPIRTASGIEIALQTLLNNLCKRLSQEGRGVRKSVFKCLRIDGNVQQISIGTNRATHNPEHLFRLFSLEISRIEPALGIEVFSLEAPLVDDVSQSQEAFWETRGGRKQIAELLDIIGGKVGMSAIRRYLPLEHHWPERSIRATNSLDEMPEAAWPDKPRPLHLLARPEPISVMVVLPDYPPSLFTHKGKVYKLIKSEGPERIETEWWLEEGLPRDYYRVEDEKGARYWIYRLGHYSDGDPQWFLHGFFA